MSRLQERLAAGEVVLLDAERDRLVQHAAHRLQVEEAEGVVVRAAADEAVPARRVAERAGDLEPQVVEVGQRHERGGRVEQRQRDGHGSALLVQVEVGLAGDEREHVAHLLEAGAQQEVRVAAVALGAEDEEVRLRVAQRRRRPAPGCVRQSPPACFEQRRRQRSSGPARRSTRGPAARGTGRCPACSRRWR